ncbi:hypothetical protein KY285_020790 [Solanum tuberosum]|nr:hypothetical protein KY285_020790 [Solanum tuberosum]
MDETTRCVVYFNTDESVLDNPGNIGAGGTNNQAEVEAAVFGLSWCVHLNYQKVVLEVDSQMLVDWLLKKSAPPWNISSQMQQLHTLTTHFSQFKCIHTLRDANFVADSLFKHSHQVTSPQLYFTSHQIPKEATTYLQQDKAGMSSFKRKKMKRIKKSH